MDKGKLFLGICIFAGLSVLGAMLPRMAYEFKSFDRIVSVKGLCEKEVPADKVIWPLVYKVVGDDINTVYNEIEVKNRIIMTFLRNGGISDNEITVSVPSISDKYAQEYGDNDRRYRYVVTNTLTVCTANVDNVLALMSQQAELMRKDIVLSNEWDSQPKFNFEGLNDIKPEMIEEATLNAREVAKKFAKDSGSKLGKIKEATQGTFSIEDRDSNTPYIKKVRVVTYVTYYLKK
ncbi:MAG: SIMPL domain-containing protein [Bacteroidaceae bacterium]|nr:SIMPL domain-containing protein [Bacteroidaceae bacterium]